jgi:hypothetical protein
MRPDFANESQEQEMKLATGRNASSRRRKTLAALERAAARRSTPCCPRSSASSPMCANAATARCSATRQFDGLKGEPARHAGRNGRGVEGAHSRAARCSHHSRRADSRFAQRNCRHHGANRPFAGLTTGQLVRPLSSSGLLCSQRPSSAAFHAAHDRHSRAGRGRRAHRRRLAQARAETLAAAHLLGITEFYRLGGAHAVAALAYGTASLPRVDKIVGPGNLYVTAAKRLVAFDCAIDMLAGPTEIVVTSERGNAPISPPILSRRPSTIPKRWPSSSPRARSGQRSHRGNKAAQPQQSRRARGSRPQRPGHRCRQRRRSARNHQSPRARAPHRRCGQRSRLGSERRLGLRRPLVRAAHGRLHLRPQSHAAHRRHGARARRPERQRLRQAHHRAAIHAQGVARSARKPRCWPKPKASPATQKPFARASRGGPVTEQIKPTTVIPVVRRAQ